MSDIKKPGSQSQTRAPGKAVELARQGRHWSDPTVLKVFSGQVKQSSNDQYCPSRHSHLLDLELELDPTGHMEQLKDPGGL